MTNESLAQLNGLFNTIYADTGRASIAPAKLLLGEPFGVAGWYRVKQLLLVLLGVVGIAHFAATEGWRPAARVALVHVALFFIANF